MTDWQVFWLMFIIVVVLWWIALTLRGRRLHQEHEAWNKKFRRYSPGKGID